MATLTTYVAVLRAINLGAHNRIAMADLKQMLIALGYGNPQTLLVSGNAVFTAPGSSTALAVQYAMVKAGLKAIYLSGWQVAADANNAGQMYPDQSLYPVSSVPDVVKRINNALARADQIQTMEGKGDLDWFAPIVADAEAGFGGVLNAHELMRAMIEAGAAGVHFEDQLASVKKCVWN